MKQRIFKAITVILLVMGLTMADFVLLGQGIAIAVGENLENQGVATNVQNVEFDAYFLEQDKKVHSKNSQIIEEQTLILEVKVKEKGALYDGKIKIENSNFRIQKDKVKNGYIKNINEDTNEIELNTIIYQNTAKLEIPIQFAKQESFDNDYFEKQHTIKLTGNYKENKEQAVDAIRTTQVNWTQETNINMTQDLEKYIVLGEEQFVQQKIVTEVPDNILPREKEVLNVDVPSLGEGQEQKIPEEVYVLHNGKKLEQSKVNYNKENRKITIQNSNYINTENKMIWGNPKNEYDIIYKYKNVVEVPAKIQLQAELQSKLYTKDETIKQEMQEVELKQKGNLVSIQEDITNQIHKGYLYANVENETQYYENDIVKISSASNVENIDITKDSEEFEDKNGKRFKINNSVFKSTTINKDEFLRIFGDNGEIIIKKQEEQILGNINKNTQADENGNITISYEQEVKNIKIVTTKPISEGNINFRHTKALKGNTGYTKEQLKSFNTLINNTKVVATVLEKTTESEIKTSVSEETVETKMQLQDTKTEAKLEVSNTNLTTLQKNENIQFLVTLKSNTAEYDLYKNPTVEIQLPSEININVKKITQLNGQNELQIVEPKLYTNKEGKKVISLKLQGEQTTFENNVNEGIQLAITADISTEKTIPTLDRNIIITYTNENRNGETFIAEVPIKLNSKYGVLMTSKLSGYNAKDEVVETIDDTLKTASLDMGAEERKATQESYIVNNYESEIVDPIFIGSISTNVESVQTEGKETKISYSENKTDWKENKEEVKNAKFFKVEFIDNKIAAKEKVKLTQTLQIPENLEGNTKIDIQSELQYNYLGDNDIAKTTIQLTTGEVQDNQESEAPENIEEIEQLKIQMTAKTGGENLVQGQEVFEGQGIKYILKVTNQNTNPITNFTMTAEHSNAIFYVEKKYQDGWNSVTGDENVEYTTIEEEPDLQQKVIKIDKINPGQTIEIPYQFSIKEVEGQNENTIGKIIFTADGLEQKEMVAFTNPINQGNVKIQLRNKYEEEYPVQTLMQLPFFVDITNLSEQTQKDAIVKVPVPEGFSFSTDYLFLAEDYQFIDYKDNIVTLKVPTIESKQKISIRLGFQVNEMDTNVSEKNYSLVGQAILEGKTYLSNSLDRTIYNGEVNITAKQTGSIEKEEVENGDNLDYTITIQNSSEQEKDIDILDYVPEGAQVKTAKIEKYSEDGNISSEETIEAEENIISYNGELGAHEKFVLTIATVIDTNYIFEEELINEVEINSLAQIIECNSVTYKVKLEENPNQNPDPDPDQNPDQNPDPEMVYRIQGTAWVDENKNGLREISEETLKDMDIILIEEDTGKIAKDNNGNEMTVKTNENGIYEFKNVKQASYLVAFKYDSNNYRVTEYQKEGVSPNTNSDVISKSINIDGKEQVVAITGSIKVEKEDLKDIDAGFIKNEIFDLKLNKYVNKIIIQNNKGTTVKQYNNTQLAKLELDSKQLANSTVIVEYTINITNEGELAGYVNEVVDYKPNDLSFSSEMNKNWYQSTDGNLYSKELTNQIIKPNETKTITLTLVKTMNQNNTGTTINTAELSKVNNDFSISDKDSVPSNQREGEDDMSTAQLIISIRTGGTVMYISLIISIIAIIVVGVYFIKKKVLTDNIE